MKIALLVTVLLVVVEGVTLFRLRQENQRLRELSDQARLQLAQALEASNAHQSEVQSIEEQMVRLQAELQGAKTALKSAEAAHPAQPLLSEAERKVQPLGLTTNDIDPNSIRLYNGEGGLAVWFAGKSAEEIQVLHKRWQPIVFGQLISKGGFVQLMRNGTNVGMVLKLESQAEAEAVAARMRGECPE